MTQTVAEILNGAADYIETNGWNQGSMFANQGDTFRACAAGAIVAIEHPTVLTGKGESAYHLADQSAAVQRFASALPGSRSLYAATTVSSWNDSGLRTAKEVVEKLRQVAAANA